MSSKPLDISDVSNLRTRAGHPILSAWHMKDGRIAYEVKPSTSHRSRVACVNANGWRLSEESPSDLILLTDDWDNYDIPDVVLELGRDRLYLVGLTGHTLCIADLFPANDQYYLIRNERRYYRLVSANDDVSLVIKESKKNTNWKLNISDVSKLKSRTGQEVLSAWHMHDGRIAYETRLNSILKSSYVCIVDPYGYTTPHFDSSSDLIFTQDWSKWLRVVNIPNIIVGGRDGVLYAHTIFGGDEIYLADLKPGINLSAQEFSLVPLD